MKAYISYQEKNKDGTEVTIDGTFDLIEEHQNYIRFSSNKNIIRIPSHLVNKLKIQELKGGIKN